MESTISDAKTPVDKIDHVQVILICGYKRHGKTTFAEDLFDKDLSKWVKVDYYGKSGKILDLFKWSSSKFEGMNIINTAFADLVKEEVHLMLGLKSDYFETHSFRYRGQKLVIKESPFYKMPSFYRQIKRRLNNRFINMDENNTLRDCYNYVGQERKKKFGQNYWAKTLVKNKSKYFYPKMKNILIISDLRFKEELAYIRLKFTNVITVRIVDPKKLIPKNIEIEHQLDNLETDYLFVPKTSFVDQDRTIEALKKIFCQSSVDT